MNAQMTIRLSLILLLTLLQAACAPMGNNGESSLTGTTGFTSPQGFEYTSNGDTRVDDALREPEVTPTAPGKGDGKNPTVPSQKPLRERLKAFDISRFDAQKPEPTRFGQGRVTLKVIFQNGERSVEFKTPLTGSSPKLQVNAKADGYTLTGELTDSPEQTKAEFQFTHLATGDTARLFYWAYRAKLTVRANRQEKITPGSDYESQLSDLRDHTFGWVNNWTVLRGPSYFIVDIVKLVAANAAPNKSAILSIKGPSLRTGDATHAVDEVKGGQNTIDGKIDMIGNAEEGTGRIFQVNVQDQKTKENHEFMLDVELDEKTVKPIAAQDDPRVVPPPDQTAVAPEIPEEDSNLPEVVNVPGARPEVKTDEAVRVGKSFLRISTSLRRTSKMTEDFNANRNVPGVKKWITTYNQGTWRQQLQRFYNTANPFRRIMEKVGQSYDVSPAYAYLTAIESAYFTGGRYKIEDAPNSTALGPFQLLTNTAKGLGLIVGGGKNDERNYFVPSACGAAKYIGMLVDKFDDSDATVAILAYFQGDGGAAAAIYCSYDSSVKDRAACVSRINKKKGYGSKDYGRFLKLTKGYNYSFAEMDRMAAITVPMREYVSKKLAIYFISNDLAKYSFDLSDAKTSMPTNGTIVPPKGIASAACREATKGLL